MPKVIFHHVCIQTNTYEESLRFYCDLLDMKIVKETAGFHGRAYNTWLQKDRFAIELQTPKGDQTFDPINSGHAGLAHLCFWVENVETACRALQAKNITDFILHNGQIVYQVNGGKLFKVKAPEGTIIEFRDQADC